MMPTFLKILQCFNIIFPPKKLLEIGVIFRVFTIGYSHLFPFCSQSATNAKFYCTSVQIGIYALIVLM